ncbi:MAG: methionine--tRNA ligase [Candidatus Moranbacteria bacterium]|nr:methionine--tRNA ligase [Candidatus Moranbacteria bacterium]
MIKSLNKPYYSQAKRVENDSFPERASGQKVPAFYITTTLPYVNGKPHIGHILEFVQADVIARVKRLSGEDVVFNTGTDEHGQKILEKAKEEGITPQAYCDRMAKHFRDVKNSLDISYTHFIRTTDENHIRAAQEFWKRCLAGGDIYKKAYETKYCVGCELEKTDSDLDHGVCPDHPKMTLQSIKEENYFFRFSKYEKALLDLYDEHPDFVVPKNRLVEIRNFVTRGLQDFSVSRLREKMPWGIPVPGDDEHVMYVWFDALVNYISTLGWPNEKECFEKFWPGVQIAGKDNLRQQSAMWQAMLLSAGLSPSRQILIHGHILSAGQKMSKSLGNVISPDELIEKFGKDGTRYVLLSAGNLEHDPDMTMERLTEKYNADLANGLGNLISRVLKLSEKMEKRKEKSKAEERVFPEALRKIIEEYRFADGLGWVMEQARAANKYIDETKPWELVKTDEEKFNRVMTKLLSDLSALSFSLEPFLPETSKKITHALQDGKIEPLFQRIHKK